MHLFICIRIAFKSGERSLAPRIAQASANVHPATAPPPPPLHHQKHLMATPTVFIRDRFQRTLRQEKHTNTFQMVNNHTTYIFLPRAKLLPLILLFSRRTLHFHAVSVVVTLREAFVAFTECRNTFNRLFMLLCLVSFWGHITTAIAM